MSAGRTHPDRVSLALWVATDSPDGELREHVDACKSCARESEILSVVATELRDELPEIPEPLRRRLRRLPDQDNVAPPASSAAQSETLPRRVRGVASLASHILVSSTDDAEISVQAQTDTDRSGWSFDGRVWLSEAVDGVIQVFLVWGEHVIASLQIADGKMFHIEETVADGWQLELHLPTGSVVLLKDPGN